MEHWVWFLLLIGLAMLWFNAARQAAEQAQVLGRAACRRAGVQWLDQSVYVTGFRFRRGEDGRLGLERSYRFEYTRDGEGRHVGSLSLLGGKLTRFVGPVAEAGDISRLDKDTL